MSSRTLSRSACSCLEASAEHNTPQIFFFCFFWEILEKHVSLSSFNELNTFSKTVFSKQVLWFDMLPNLSSLVQTPVHSRLEVSKAPRQSSRPAVSLISHLRAHTNGAEGHQDGPHCYLPNLPNLLWYLACLVWVVKIVKDFNRVMKKTRPCLSALIGKKPKGGTDLQLHDNSQSAPAEATGATAALTCMTNDFAAWKSHA